MSIAWDDKQVKAQAYDHYKLGEYQEALNLFNKLRKNTPLESDTDKFVEIAKMQGNCLFQQGKIDEALEKFEDSFRLANANNNLVQVSKRCNNIANCWIRKEDFRKASDWIEKGIKIAQNPKDPKEKPEYDLSNAALFRSRAVLNHIQDKLSDAETDFKFALQIFENYNLEEEMMRVKSLLAALYISIGDKLKMKEARNILEESLLYAQKLNAYEAIKYNEIKLALIEFLEENYDETQKRLKQSLGTTPKSIENPLVLLEAYYIWAVIDYINGDLNQYESHIIEAKKIAQNINSKHWILQLDLEEYIFKTMQRNSIQIELIKGKTGSDQIIRKIFLSGTYLFGFGALTKQYLVHRWLDLDFGSLLNQFTKAIERLLYENLGIKLKKNLEKKWYSKDVFGKAENPYKNMIGKDRILSVKDWQILLKMSLSTSNPTNQAEADVIQIIRTYPNQALLRDLYDVLPNLYNVLNMERNSGVHNEGLTLDYCLKIIDNSAAEINRVINLFYTP